MSPTTSDMMPLGVTSGTGVRHPFTSRRCRRSGVRSTTSRQGRSAEGASRKKTERECWRRRHRRVY